MTPKHDARRPGELLPLKPDVFLILTILAQGAQYGYGIMQTAEEWSGGRVRLQAGALYRRLKWMLEHDLIEELQRRPVDEDERRRYYGLTRFGQRVADAEAKRMEELLMAARHPELLAGLGKGEAVG